MLETLDDPSIYRMTTEEVPEQRDAFFDPKKDITESDRDRINLSFIEYRSDARLGSDPMAIDHLLHFAYHMHVLHIPVDLSEADKANLEKSRARYQLGNSEFSQVTFILQKLGIPVVLTESDKRIMKNEALSIRNWHGGNAMGVAELAYYMNELGIKFGLTEKEKKLLKEYFQRPKNSDQIWDFAVSASHVAHLPDLAVELSIDDKEKMKDQLESLSQSKHVWPFTQLASAMSILSKSIKPEISASAPEMPEQREF